ncbi:hypothetical protein [Sphingomonas sp. KR3-1]|uniref:hypothetical protein n=1 Tax=Sphingomonas sp. KR3-1 TaxID=3156611 RepID=UPI0032B5C447
MGDKQPYIVTVIVGVLTWLVTHIVASVVEAPTLEYSMRTASQGQVQVVTLDLSNVTRAKRFDGISVMITVPGGPMERARIQPVEPAAEGDNAPDAAGQTASFTIPHLLPGETYRLTAESRSSATPALRIDASSQAIRIVEANLETFCARHELSILIAMFVLWATFLAVIAYRMRKSPVGGQQEEPKIYLQMNIRPHRGMSRYDRPRKS